MYGLVNHGIQTFVTDNHGPVVWRSICAAARTSTNDYEPMLVYEDDETYRLVAVISERLGLDTAKVLEVFGDFWVDYSQHTSVGKLIAFGGRTLPERLEGLDDLHEHVARSMPHLKPPSFEFETGADNVHILHYFSEREGLQPMVIGLLHGIARDTGESIRVRHIAKKEEGADHDSFEIEVLAQDAHEGETGERAA
ncbi:MAG: heme NO-binding domain-containing protein [Pseudomonadota bacterium]